jgi:5-methylcytosine-specific restriction protein A
MNTFEAKNLLVVDLNSGSYIETKIGHELYNLIQNPVDGYFYGYCPRNDGVEITHFGANPNDEYINGILVVYVSKKKNSSNREIIAFCLNTTVFKKPQSEIRLNRIFRDTDEVEKTATYSVRSDNLLDLRNRSNKFEIDINDYSTQMFRQQRFYGGKYPELDKKIIAYIESILENKELLDDDDCDEQEEIQKAEPATKNEIQSSADRPLNIVKSNQGKVISKDSRIAKSALEDANFSCAIDPTHKTFLTTRQIQYMEGHHLIPCTVENSEAIKDKFKKNIDCFENIVCICPTCHREVHFGNWDSKAEKIKLMYKKQREKLEVVGISITEEELLKLYRKDKHCN